MKSLKIFFWITVPFAISAWLIPIMISERRASVILVSFLISWVPGLIAVGLIDFAQKREETERIVWILLAIGIRISFSLGGAVISYYLFSFIQSQINSFIVWGLGFYLLLLILETKVLIQRLNHFSKPGNRT